MPNHVKNIVHLQGDQQKVKEVLETVKNNKYGIGSVDFDKILPTPSALHIECGSKTDRGLKAYREFLKSGTESERQYLAKTVDITPETWELGKQAYKNILEYGAPTWYEWCIVHWGTKWNAYGFEDNTAEKPSSELYFQTAWDAPPALLTRLSDMYPDVTFEYEWADENIGSNCGSKKLLNGEILDEFFPAGKQAMDFAMNLWGYEPVDLELVLNRTGTGYINVGGRI